MIRTFNIAATGMEANTFNVDAISNDLANVNTTGYKGTQVNFQDLLYENLIQPGTQYLNGAPLPTGIQLGSGVRVSSTTKIFTQGPLSTATGNPLNMAIEDTNSNFANDFFQLTRPDGTIVYTRDGTFSRDPTTGNIVNQNGYFLTPTISLPTNYTSVTVGTDGSVQITTPSSTTPTTVGTVQLALFPSPQGLAAIGNNLFQQTAASGTPILTAPMANGAGQIMGGVLEQSNVDVVTSLVNLIQAERAYEFDARAITAADNILEATVALVR